jgi:hypothetical protein
MYRRFRAFAAAAAILVGAAGFAGCDIAVQGNGEGGLHFDVGAQARDQWSRSYKLAPGARIELININGRITAEASDGDTLEITGERIAKATSDEAAKTLLSNIEMREEVGDARVRIEVRPPQRRGSGGHEIKWTIRVPKGVAVDLRTINGGVKLAGLTGDVRVRSTNGGITGEAVMTSNIDAAVTNGGVEIELGSAPASSGSIDLESVNGGVSLTLPGESKADITARCVNGGIQINGLSLDIIGEQTRRKVEGKLNGGGIRVMLDTTNGGVRLNKATT